MAQIYLPTDHVTDRSLLPSFEQYEDMHKMSLEQPEAFWSEIVNEFHWQTPPTPGNFMSYNFDINKGRVFIKFMEGAMTNVCFNVLDRNVRNGHGDKIAFYW